MRRCCKLSEEHSARRMFGLICNKGVWFHSLLDQNPDPESPKDLKFDSWSRTGIITLRGIGVMIIRYNVLLGITFKPGTLKYISWHFVVCRKTDISLPFVSVSSRPSIVRTPLPRLLVDWWLVKAWMAPDNERWRKGERGPRHATFKDWLWKEISNI